MDNFFNILKKGVVATVFFMFATVMVYVPQDWNSIKEAQAGGGAGGALEVTQLAQWAEDIAFHASQLAQQTIVAVSTAALHAKDLVGDGLAWAALKSLLNTMVQDLIAWAQSGFEGRPAFVSDLRGFLTAEADRMAGEFISNVSPSLCSPFRLDIQVALNLHYNQVVRERVQPECTLTDVIDNIETFTSGARGSFSSGGWDDWLDISANPASYSKYGAYLAAESNLEIAVAEKKFEQHSLLGFADGFFSTRQCEMIDNGDGTFNEHCEVVTPGKLVQEALSFNLDTERQILIEADEIQELLGAFIAGLVQRAFEGADGILGL